MSLFRWGVFGLVCSFLPLLGSLASYLVVVAALWRTEQLALPRRVNPLTISVTASCIGWVGWVAAVYLPVTSVNYLSLKVYVCSLCLFHMSEFLCQSYFNPAHSSFTSKTLVSVPSEPQSRVQLGHCHVLC